MTLAAKHDGDIPLKICIQFMTMTLAAKHDGLRRSILVARQLAGPASACCRVP
jgi:hypothetical protein